MRFAERALGLGASEAGFTLLEMLVVLAIVGLGILVTVLAVQPIMDRTEVRRTILAFKSLSHLARQTAIEREEPVSLSIDTGTRALTVERLHRSEILPADVGLSWVSALGLSDATAGARHQASILFLPDGTSSGGTFLVRLRNAQEKVRISWVSGAAVDAAP